MHLFISVVIVVSENIFHVFFCLTIDVAGDDYGDNEKMLHLYSLVLFDLYFLTHTSEHGYPMANNCVLVEKAPRIKVQAIILNVNTMVSSH